MRLIEQKIEYLENIDIPLSPQDNFDSFGNEAADKVNIHNPEPKMTELKNYPLKNIKVYDSVFHGLDGNSGKKTDAISGTDERK